MGGKLERILRECGYTVNCVLTGDSSYLDIKNLHLADLNLVQCHRSINYIAEMMETKYGTPWLKVNFIGIESTNDSLRQIARCFDDEELARKTEEVIERETARIGPILDQYRKILQGKTAFAIVGGSRSHHYQYLLHDLGMEMIIAGYEFAHGTTTRAGRSFPPSSPTPTARTSPSSTRPRRENIPGSARPPEHVQGESLRSQKKSPAQLLRGYLPEHEEADRSLSMTQTTTRSRC